MLLMFLILLLSIISITQSFTPNCVPENQFRNFGFPVEACSDYFHGKCKFHPKGYFKSLGDAPLVKIKETAVVPTCAFFNVPKLRCIYGVNSKIKVLATGAFINLPNLEAIHLEYNQIIEVRKDIFKNISTELLDLSWNKIAFIDSNAFKDVSGLKYLNLSRNSLLTLSINHLTATLQSLNLAYNLLESFALNSDSFLNLTVVNVSNNAIDKVAISLKYPAEILDLTNNRIKNFDYMDIISVEKFKMGKNLFQDAPQYLENINAQEIDIYPNPWKCDKLMLLWETLVSFNIRLAKKESSKNPPPECYNGDNRLVTSTRSTDCLDDYECPSNMACRGNKCWDPCEASFCHSSSSCQTNNHAFFCSCSYGRLMDPLDIYGECKNIECFVDSQCPPTSNCWNNHCIKNELPDSGSSPTYENSNHNHRGNSASAVSSHYGSSGHSSENSGFSSGGYSGASSGFSSGGYSGPSLAPNSDVYAGANSGYTINGGSEGSSLNLNIPSKNVFPMAPEYPTTTPWWFEDIPNVVPPESKSRKMTLEV